MKIKIQSLHFTLTPNLANFITENVSKLSHITESIPAADICLKLDKSNVLENKVCEIKLRWSGNTLFAKRNHKTFEQATMEVIDALHSQILKQKTKFENSKIALPNDVLIEML